MPRDTDALKIRKWAESGDVATPESQGLDRATGWPASYSQPNGDLPKREVLNQLLREPSALGVELNQHGLLEWHSAVSYVHPAVVMGSDGQVYVSVADNAGVDPVSDVTNASWKLLARQGPVGERGPMGSTSGFTYEELDANGDVGTGSDQVAAGDHDHEIAHTLDGSLQPSFAHGTGSGGVDNMRRYTSAQSRTSTITVSSVRNVVVVSALTIAWDQSSSEMTLYHGATSLGTIHARPGSDRVGGDIYVHTLLNLSTGDHTFQLSTTGTESSFYPTFPISTLQGVPYSATELLDVAE